MGAFAVREVQAKMVFKDGEPAIITQERKQNPRVTLQAIVVLSLLIPFTDA